MPIDLRFGPDEAPLMIDLYELTMAASYYRIGFDQPACFYLSVRRMPPKRGFLVAAGIERVLEAAEAIVAREEVIAQALREGQPISQVMGANYEHMLKKQAT